MNKFTVILLVIHLPSFCFAQNPLRNYSEGIQSRFSDKQPVINYTVTVDKADLSVVSVQIQLRNVADTFQLAMYAHPEYDDKYWRYVEGLEAETGKGNAVVFREDNALWRVISHHNEAIIRYKLHLPQLTAFGNLRSAWHPFLSETGGLIGDYHTFMYIVGQTLAPSHIHFQIPDGWQIATGLEPTADPYTYYAPSAEILMDAPALIGHFKSWRFRVDGVPHTIAYWALPGASAFDTTTLVSAIQKIVTQATPLFGRLPYREYFFLLQDGSYGALEHNNSVTLGIPSKQLAENISGHLEEIAHEYFHAWNMIRLHPAEFGDISYQRPALSKQLWWSEGLTMFYADLLLRRADIARDTLSRIDHLAALIQRYYNDAGNHKFSAEKVSVADNAPPGFLGDYDASTHLQGEILGDLLDFMIRDATNGRSSIDNLMRSMFYHFSGVQGFTGNDIERATNSICNCNVHTFFEDYVRGNELIDFNKYLHLIGLKINISWTEAVTDDKKPAPDTRIYAWNDRSSHHLKMGLTDPESCWGKAGLHTGDVIKKINDSAVDNTNDFDAWFRKLKVGDIANIVVERNKETFNASVIITGYKTSVAHITQLPVLSEKQQRLAAQWLSGKN